MEINDRGLIEEMDRNPLELPTKRAIIKNNIYYLKANYFYIVLRFLFIVSGTRKKGGLPLFLFC